MEIPKQFEAKGENIDHELMLKSIYLSINTPKTKTEVSSKQTNISGCWCYFKILVGRHTSFECSGSFNFFA